MGVRDGQSSSFGRVDGSLRSQRLQNASLMRDDERVLVGFSGCCDDLGGFLRRVSQAFSAVVYAFPLVRSQVITRLSKGGTLLTNP